jgi:hypothetical protein
MKRYKDLMVAPGTTLWDLMHKKSSNPEESKAIKKALEKQYDDIQENYNKLHSKEVQDYFAEKQREYFAKNKPIQPQPVTQTVESMTL